MNPELRRYAWLELGTHRLLLTPLVLAALVAIPVASAQVPERQIGFGAVALFLLLTVGWGSMRALSSVTDEVRDRTWDFQRMAAFTPAELATGKVLGAPIFQWYVGAWCLAVMAAAGTRVGVPQLPSLLTALVAGTVMLHALAVALSTAGAHARLGERTRRGASLLLVFAVVQVVPFGGLLQPGTVVYWWDWRMPPETFIAAGLVLFAGWAWVAAWRTMMRELQEPARAWPWPAFAVFAAVWWAGLSTPAQPRPSFGDAAAVAAGVLVCATYVACMLEPLTRVVLGRMSRACRQPVASRWQPRLPDWALHGTLSVPAGALAFHYGREALSAFALPVALMAVRDAAVISCFALSRSARPPIGRAVFYIALADLLVPALALAVQWPALARVAFPLWAAPQSPSLAAWGMAIHALLALVALGLCIARARRAAG